VTPGPPGPGLVTLPDSPWTRSHGSRGPAPLSYHGRLSYGTLLPSCPDSSHIPPGLPALRSHYPPLAVQLPHHSDRAPCSQRKRMPKPRGHVTLSTTALAPQTKRQLWTCQSCTKPPATLGARQWHHDQMLPGVLAPTGTTEDLTGTLPPPYAAASTSGCSPAQAPQARAPNATSQHRWGGVYSKPTLLLSVRGCEWGSKPLSSDTHCTSQHGRKRTHVADRLSPLRVATRDSPLVTSSRLSEATVSAPIVSSALARPLVRVSPRAQPDVPRLGWIRNEPSRGESIRRPCPCR
jgi:hypothetical protein